MALRIESHSFRAGERRERIQQRVLVRRILVEDINMAVTSGGKDQACLGVKRRGVGAVGQGHELFTALQRQRVPSRFINFPDEGHWVLKPKNSEYWHKEVFAWLTKYVPPGGR